MQAPDRCTSLVEVRTAIDTLDRELLALLGRRAQYVHAAARFKRDVQDVPAPDRMRSMLEQRRAWAVEEQLDPAVVVELFTLLVNYFIRREQAIVAARPDGQS